jgi:hypothetical protein
LLTGAAFFWAGLLAGAAAFCAVVGLAFCVVGLVTLALDFCEVWDDTLADLEWVCATGALTADVGLATAACFCWGEAARWLFWAAGAFAGACFCWGDAAFWADAGLLTGAAAFCAAVGLTAF